MRALAVVVAGALASAAAAGCAGESGTITISLVTAPGSAVLDPVTRLRATLSSPFRQVEAERDADGFALDLEVVADGRGAVVVIEGFDAGGQRLVVGVTPPLPLAAVDADVAVYLAPPLSLGAAPVGLDPPRSEIGAGLLPYGLLIAGGRGGDGLPIADVVVYNAYEHVMQIGEDLPSARAGVTMMMSPTGYAYMFGGDGGAGATGTLWRFDTDAEPDGEYLDLDDDPALARVNQDSAAEGFEQYVVSGEPPVIVNGYTGLSAVMTVTRLPPVATSVQDTRLPDDPRIYSVFVGSTAGATGVVSLTDGLFQDEAAPADAPRLGHGMVPSPDISMVVIGGHTTADGLLRSALRYIPTSRMIATYPDALITARDDAAIASNGEVLIVAGGVDGTGAIVPDAEVKDLLTLAHIATIPMVVPRTRAIARPLPNGQIVILGGVDATGAPVGTIELFNPDITAPGAARGAGPPGAHAGAFLGRP